MLTNSPITTTIAVNDLENAIDFYGTVLGLELIGKNPGGMQFAAGNGIIGLYESATAGTGQSTCAWWTVDGIETVVKELQKRGVVFDKNYDLPYAKRKGSVYLLDDGVKAAWFRDPDGNILGIGNY